MAYLQKISREIKAGSLLKLISFFILIFFSSISWANNVARDDIIRPPTPQKFSVCHGYSCAYLSIVSLKSQQWAEVAQLFAVPAPSPEGERMQIRYAIAKMERLVGAMTGTSADRARNKPNDVGIGARMDCIDESTNSTTYLMMFEQAGWLRHHDVLSRRKRGFFPFVWPHYAAVIESHSNGEWWAVDSWFLKNGEMPFIVPFSEWEKGWEPSDVEETQTAQLKVGGYSN